MTTYTTNPPQVFAAINEVKYHIGYAGTVPEAIPSVDAYPSGVRSLILDWWKGEDQSLWQQRPDSEPLPVNVDIIGFFNQFTSPNSPGKSVYDSLASRALSIGGVTMLHFSNLQLLLLNPLTTEAMVVEGYNHLISLFDQNGQPLTAEENQALRDLTANYGINL